MQGMYTSRIRHPFGDHALGDDPAFHWIFDRGFHSLFALQYSLFSHVLSRTHGCPALPRSLQGASSDDGGPSHSCIRQ
jgi:hypothetical protein